jgi:hypothetical protein
MIRHDSFNIMLQLRVETDVLTLISSLAIKLCVDEPQFICSQQEICIQKSSGSLDSSVTPNARNHYST